MYGIIHHLVLQQNNMILSNERPWEERKKEKEICSNSRLLLSVGKAKMIMAFRTLNNVLYFTLLECSQNIV